MTPPTILKWTPSKIPYSCKLHPNFGILMVLLTSSILILVLRKR